MPKAENLVGQKFNMLTVVSLSGVTERGLKLYMCECECGNIKEFYGTAVKSGRSKSCGCLTRHGMTGTKEYTAWLGMYARCYNEKNDSFSEYGGRGIRICDSWREKYKGFPSFYADMGPCPDGMSLDRIDVNGDYCPENCRWADISTQNFNQRLKVTNKSGKTGVRFVDNKWVATITHKLNRVYLGAFESFEEAVKARENAEILYYGVLK